MSYVVPPKWARYWLASASAIHHFGDWSHGGERRAQRGRLLRRASRRVCSRWISLGWKRASCSPHRPPPLWVSAHFMNIYKYLPKHKEERDLFHFSTISQCLFDPCRKQDDEFFKSVSNMTLLRVAHKCRSFLVLGGDKSSTNTAVLLFAICVIRCRCHEINMSWLYLRSIPREKPRLTRPRAFFRRSWGYTTWRKHEKALFFWMVLSETGGGRQRCCRCEGPMVCV